MPNWNAFCDRLPGAEQAALWDVRHSDGLVNYGLALGAASNLIALDIDTDDPATLAFLPPSPVRKRGKKGETRFFRYTPGIRAQKLREYGIEILASGNQTIIPPSLHPDGMYYVWVTPDDLFSIQSADLPELDTSFLNHLDRLTPSIHQAAGTPGRNNQLVSMATAAFTKGKTVELVATELLEYDATKHTPPLFSDPSGDFSRSSDRPYLNATQFASSVYTSLIKRGLITEAMVKREAPLEDLDPLDPEEEALDREREAAEQEFSLDNFKWPRARGMMRLFQEYLELYSDTDNSGISLAAALSWMGTLLSNRVMGERFDGKFTTPNHFIIYMAPSGYGKDDAMRLVVQLLSPYNLLGSMSYKSSTSLIMGLGKERQEFLAPVDEISMMLGSMSSRNGERHQKEMAETLCHLFSSAPTEFQGVASLTHKERFGACYTPHLNILGATTPNGFVNSVDSKMTQNGLMSRFVVFNQLGFEEKEVSENADALAEPKLKTLESFTRDFLGDMKKRVPIDLPNPNPEMGDRIRHYIVKRTPEATAYAKDLKRFYRQKMRDHESNDNPFYNRFVEMALKFALIDWASEPTNWFGREEPQWSPITQDNVEWGMQVVLAAYNSARPLYKETNSETLYQKQLEEVLAYIKKRKKVHNARFASTFRRIEKKEREKIINHLKEAREISVELYGKSFIYHAKRRS